MMDEGWVYVLVNSSTPGMAKVGRTERAPAERAAELSGVTGVATPFIVAFEQFFTDCHAAERAVHAELDRCHLRVAPNREFFRGPPIDIINVVRAVEERASGGTGRLAKQTARLEQAAGVLLQAGDRSLLGSGDALQDTAEAIKCYKLAAARGSSLALERLGGVYLDLHRAEPSAANRRRALAPLKEGVRRGNAYCYCEMAELFALDGHVSNFVKSWQMFFVAIKAGVSGAGVSGAGVSGAGVSGAGAGVGVGAEAEAARFVNACARYIRLCVDMRLQPADIPGLRESGEAIVAALLAHLKRLPLQAVERGPISAALRWAYSWLLAEPAALARPAARQGARRRWFLTGSTAAAA